MFKYSWVTTGTSTKLYVDNYFICTSVNMVAWETVLDLLEMGKSSLFPHPYPYPYPNLTLTCNPTYEMLEYFYRYEVENLENLEDLPGGLFGIVFTMSVT